ncbi:hypothetical protein EW145_g6807 [Phellinidium pouzarii]|uniref:NADP-dependent oxidoreductase domain-containing protein n=1 Tax=Phellinidium pouzarii TaxID=167371 RepID=A0A4S4KTU3_9AGAM|nr:hypothetical protein EW145_g6807 [Phellinidium pouzarii]
MVYFMCILLYSFLFVTPSARIQHFFSHQCHRFDKDTPIEETMQALHDVVKAGYLRYIGMPSCYAWQYYALTHNLTPFISMQNHYNVVYRHG